MTPERLSKALHMLNMGKATYCMNHHSDLAIALVGGLFLAGIAMLAGSAMFILGLFN